MSIQLHNLTKIYGTQLAVDHISFSAGKAEIVGFLGPNGAGKTTTMKMICGYLQATEGEIKVCGMDIAEYPIEVKRKIGYLPEHNPLYKDMYVREYLLFFAKLLKIANPKKRVEDCIELTGLSIEQNKRIGSLSKGYRQRVGLSQALLHDPEVLILDEPTSGLDPNQLMEIRQLIRRIGNQKTLLLSTHIMQEVQALCDRVLIINKGKLVADEPIGALLQMQKHKRIISIEFASQVDVSQLSKISLVESVQKVSEYKFLIHSAAENDIREELFKICAKNSWTILEMKEEKSSIEFVFNQLTTSK